MSCHDMSFDKIIEEVVNTKDCLGEDYDGDEELLKELHEVL